MAKTLKICTLFTLAMAPQGVYPGDIISFVHKIFVQKMFLHICIGKKEREREN